MEEVIQNTEPDKELTQFQEDLELLLRSKISYVILNPDPEVGVERLNSPTADGMFRTASIGSLLNT